MGESHCLDQPDLLVQRSLDQQLANVFTNELEDSGSFCWTTNSTWSYGQNTKIRSQWQTNQFSTRQMEFPDVGQHCTFKSCHKLEYCPFKCDLCKDVFCTKHRNSADHACPNMVAKEDRRTYSCPLCQALLVPQPGQDPNEIGMFPLFFENFRLTLFSF